MPRQEITFPNQNGESLAALLELPATQPRTYALFAHCFTCGKDIAAASRISRTLAAAGIAVLRFDFTGLGGSDGDFANTHFSANVADLVAAANYMRRTHAAPTLLIGHSLGGTAVLAAAGDMPEVRAVVTIGAPATAKHVIRQFGADVEIIERLGEAEVELAGRSFRINRAFLENAEAQNLAGCIRALKRALLVMHAPLDNIVSIDEAGKIFGEAFHPKSFVSLDDADHLLSNAADAQYAANTIAAWADRFIPQPDIERGAVPSGRVLVTEGNRKFLRHVTTDNHSWLADEPKRVGGDNLGPDPYEHLLAALGTCTSMTIRMYANRKAMPLEEVSIELVHHREHAADCDGCDEAPHQIDVISRTIFLEGSLDDQQRARLLEIADRCPVHRTLENEIRINTADAGRGGRLPLKAPDGT
jgi:putative redox protein